MDSQPGWAACVDAVAFAKNSDGSFYMNGHSLCKEKDAADGGRYHQSMRIAFFGGSFDPPHRGHLAIAAAAANRFQLDQVLFAPVGQQPLKQPGALTAFEDRLAMVVLACAADARFVPCNADAPRTDGQPNYTIDTLTAARATLPPGTELFCLVGADSFADLPRWREPERLLTLCEWIVVSRPGFALPIAAPEAAARVHILNGVCEDVSATAIRAEIQHRPDDHLTQDAVLPDTVMEYIRQHRLYGA